MLFYTSVSFELCLIKEAEARIVNANPKETYEEINVNFIL